MGQATLETSQPVAGFWVCGMVVVPEQLAEMGIVVNSVRISL